MHLKKRERPWVIAGVVYLIIGMLFLYLSLHPTFISTWTQFFSQPLVAWVIAWASIGIGAGLINRRDHRLHSCWVLHFVCYYGFILIIVFLSAFVVASKYLDGGTIPDIDLQIGALTALVAVFGGFLGPQLNDIIKATFEKIGGKS